MSNVKKLIKSLSPWQRDALCNELVNLTADISESGLTQVSQHVADTIDDQAARTYSTGFSHGTFDAMQVVQDAMTRVRYISNEVERKEGKHESN